MTLSPILQYELLREGRWGTKTSSYNVGSLNRLSPSTCYLFSKGKKMIILFPFIIWPVDYLSHTVVLQKLLASYGISRSRYSTINPHILKDDSSIYTFWQSGNPNTWRINIHQNLNFKWFLRPQHHSKTPKTWTFNNYYFFPQWWIILSLSITELYKNSSEKSIWN